MISVENVSKSFDEVLLFKDLSLHIHEGASHVLIGPSGAGKSVLLKMIAGLMPYDSGRIEVKSKNVSMLFQKNALFDSFSLEENLLFPLRERKKMTGREALKRAHHFLDEVGLLQSKDLLPDEISGGMQKRLGIARALVIEPEVMLYDEPTAGLDPITSRIIADLIISLRKEVRSTLLVVTTDMFRARQLGDEIWLLAQGQLSHAGTPDTIAQNPDARVKQFYYGFSKGPLTSQ